MAEVVIMPKMSDTMTEGTIVAWHKKVGDKVKSGDLLAEIETDKAVMEFESFQEGVLLYIGAEKGQAVKVNDVIAVLGKEGEDYKAALETSGQSKAKESQQPEKPAVKKESAPKKEAATMKKEEPKKKAEEEVAEKEEEPEENAVTEVKDESATEEGRTKISPLAKRMAKEAGVSLGKVKGSGDEGRIIKRDIEKLLTQKRAPVIPVEEMEESYEEVTVSQMRKTIARRLVESKFSSPHFYLTMEMNMDRCTEMRTQINEIYPDQKISFNDIIIKATALALKKNPKVNSSWLGDDGSGQFKIRYNHHVHVGMAVAVEDGLLVPVIRFADQKTFAEINDEAKKLAAKAKEKKLQPDEMQGNTFTISNLGMMDIDEFTAIINPPDACILAVGKIKKSPVVVNEQIRVANILKATLSCDHRVVDGATGALFLQTLKSILENPISMLL